MMFKLVILSFLVPSVAFAQVAAGTVAAQRSAQDADLAAARNSTTTPNLLLPSIVNCDDTASISYGSPIGGGTVDFPKESKACNRRQDAIVMKVYFNMPEAGILRMCQGKDNKLAMVAAYGVAICEPRNAVK